jgi:hypothetical protein
MILENRPILRVLVQVALLLLLLALAVAAIDLLSRLGIHHPNIVGFAVLSVFAVVIAIRWFSNRKETF